MVKTVTRIGVSFSVYPEASEIFLKDNFFVKVNQMKEI